MQYDVFVYEELGEETELLLGIECSRIDDTEVDRPRVYQFDDLTSTDVWNLRELVKLYPYQYEIIQKSDKVRKTIWPSPSGMSLDQVLDL